MRKSTSVLSVVLACVSAVGQELLWRIPAVGGAGYAIADALPDFDGDGADDLVAFSSTNYAQSGSQWGIAILSGRTGTLLHSIPPSPGYMGAAGGGDFDGDGYPECVFALGYRIHVYSPRRGLTLHSVPPATQIPAPGFGLFGIAWEAHIDLDGDGLGDLLGATVNPRDSALHAYDHTGALRYSIEAWGHGWLIESVANIGDRDGDGGEDFLVGARGGPQAEGGVFLFSGRTGAQLRGHLGLQPFDLIGGAVGPAGDMDLDGVADYFASSSPSFYSRRQVTVVWSGATGAVIRTWVDPNFLLGMGVTARHDADLDGVPDVLFACPACSMEPFNYGAVMMSSSRDGAFIQETHSARGIDYSRNVADLGIQPGNPHPVYAVDYVDSSPTSYAFTLEVWRSQPVRSSLSGVGCGTTGNTLIPGLRKTNTGSRLQIAGAPPGALACCILGDGAATTASGLPLPVALDPYGCTGCSLNVPLDFVDATLTGTTGLDRGYAAFDLPVAMAATGGRRFAVQWRVLDPATGFESWTVRRDFWLR